MKEDLFDEIKKLKQENARLRAIFPEICDALGNGACCVPDVSLEFLEQIPQEIRLLHAESKYRSKTKRRT